MPRRPRVQPGGYVFHVLNRGNGRMRLFDDDGDYAAFERCLAEALEAVPVRLLAYCLMPNHWHLVLYPRADGDLGRFMLTLTATHVRRWHLNRHSVGGGHVYQGTYKSFPVQSDEHFLTVARYVERNAVRATLCKRAEDWRWCSLWRRRFSKGTGAGAGPEGEEKGISPIIWHGCGVVVSCGHAQTTTRTAGRLRVPRAQPRQRADAPFR